MPSGYEHIWASALTATLVLYLIYRRFRRSFGRQPLRPTRMIVRATILCVIALLLLPAALRSIDIALAIGAGLAVGVGLAVWGAKHTRFEWHQDQLHYVPYTYTGMVVSAVFLGRLIYRFLVIPHGAYWPVAGAPRDPSPAGALGSLYQNPLTLSVFFVLIGYYVYYYSYVLWESKHVKREDLAGPTAAN